VALLAKSSQRLCFFLPPAYSANEEVICRQPWRLKSQSALSWHVCVLGLTFPVVFSTPSFRMVGCLSQIHQLSPRLLRPVGSRGWPRADPPRHGEGAARPRKRRVHFVYSNFQAAVLAPSFHVWIHPLNNAAHHPVRRAPRLGAGCVLAPAGCFLILPTE